MRHTKQELNNLFKSYCNALGLKVAESYKDLNALHLDYIAEYGGYQIVQYLPNGGETCPLGPNRRSLSELCDCLHFALRTLGIDRNGLDSSNYWPDSKLQNSN